MQEVGYCTGAKRLERARENGRILLDGGGCSLYSSKQIEFRLVVNHHLSFHKDL